MTIRIAVMSDLHCHGSSAKPHHSFLLTDALRVPPGNHPVEALKHDVIQRESLRADVLLAPGDLTNQTDRQGLVSGWDFIHEVADSLSAGLIVSTLGNHDVDSRHLASGDPFRLPRGIGKNYPVPDGSESAHYWADGFSVIETAGVRIITVNSVADHLDEINAERGSVSTGLIASLDRRLNTLSPHRRTIGLVHHHPIQHELTGMESSDLLLNGQPLLDCLARHGVRLVVHGHKHYPRLRYFDAAGASVVIFAAGSFSAINANMLSTRNLFHILELPDETLPGCALLGRIHSWEYSFGRGWSPSHQRSADIPSIAGFGCTCEPQALADEIGSFANALNKTVVSWSTIVSQFPRLPYIAPAQFKLVARRLKDVYAMRVMPDSGEPPENLVRISGDAK